LPESDAARLLQQLIGAREDGRPQHREEKIVCQKPEAVFLHTFVPFEIEVVKNLAAVLVSDGE
jgi:hypothetical protein